MGKEKLEKGRVPKSILDKINEHTIGGFILFYFNAYDGSPEHVMTFDSHVHSMAMQKYLNDWSDAVRDINMEATRHQIMSQNNPEEPLE